MRRTSKLRYLQLVLLFFTFCLFKYGFISFSSDLHEQNQTNFPKPVENGQPDDKHLEKEYGTNFHFKAEDMDSLVARWRNHPWSSKRREFRLDIMSRKQYIFMPNYRNPCFVDEGVMKCYPYMFIIGAEKSGTSDLYEKLCLHQNVIRAKHKEPFYWQGGRKEFKSLQWYLDFFKDPVEKIKSTSVRKDGQDFHPMVTLDGSCNLLNDNSNWMDLPENDNFTEPVNLIQNVIRHYLPDAKFLAILRNPTQRLYSDYMYFAKSPNGKYKTSPEDFHKRVVYGTKWMQDCYKELPRQHCLYSPPEEDRSKLEFWYQSGFRWNVIARMRIGMYVDHLLEWYRAYPRKQIMVLHLTEYSSNRLEWLNKIFNFLELEPMRNTNIKALQRNVNSQNKTSDLPMLPETKRILDDFHRPFNKRLAVLLRDKKWLFE